MRCSIITWALFWMCAGSKRNLSDYQDLQDPEDLYQFVARCQEVAGTFTCSICREFKASRRGLVRNHVESIHFRGVFRYSCDICSKEFQGRNALAVHNSSLHPTRPKAFPSQEEGPPLPPY